MKKSFWVFIMLSSLIFIGSQTFAQSKFIDKIFKTLDNKYYCTYLHHDDDEFELCTENDFNQEKQSHWSMNWLFNVDNRVYCISQWIEQDISKCDNVSIQIKNFEKVQCTIKNWVENCIPLEENEANISIGIINTENYSWINNKNNSTFIVNWQNVDSKEILAKGTSIFKGITWFVLIALVIGIIWFIFWIMMLVDAIRHEKENKALWIIILFLANTLGAIVYYFVVKRPRNKMEQQQNSVQQNLVSNTPVVNTNFPQQFYQQPSQDISTPPIFQQPQQEIIQQTETSSYQTQQQTVNENLWSTQY